MRLDVLASAMRFHSLFRSLRNFLEDKQEKQISVANNCFSDEVMSKNVL